MNLLLKLLNNIVNNPTDSKYRRLNSQNPRLAKELLSVNGCLEFLIAAGFSHDVNGEYKLPLTTDVSHVRDELQDFIEVETANQQRLVRDARIKRIREEEAKPTLSRSWRTARAELQTSAEEAASSVAPAQPQQLTVNVQSFVQVTPVTLPAYGTVALLRSTVAAQNGCQSEQLWMTLVTASGEGSKLTRNFMPLKDCGITDGCTVVINIREADEILQPVASITSTLQADSAVLANEAGLEHLARDMSWRFTQEMLCTAEQNGYLTQPRARELKRSLHMSDLSLKDVRVQITMEAQQASGNASPFQELIEKYLGLSSGIRPVLESYKNCNKIAEENRRYSEMIARDNAEGLKRSGA